MRASPPQTGTDTGRPGMSGGAGEQHSDVRHMIGIVDDDRVHFELLSRILNCQTRVVQRYESGESFLQAVGPNSVGCVIAELVMPDMSGRQLQQELRVAAPALSLIVISGHADVPTTVDLMSRGAVTVMEKPARAAELISAVAQATQQSIQTHARISRAREIERRLTTLTVDEYQIANEMIAGTPIKALAHAFRISMRTVDRRRQAVLSKMQVSSVGELASLFAETSMRTNASRMIRWDQPATVALPHW